MKKKFSRLSILVSFALAAMFVAILAQHSTVARAQWSATSSFLTGYAWSDNIGWISFSGTNPDYGISEDASGNLTGYAWSDNIGWIKFGGLSGFPSGSGTSNQNASIDSSGILHGWVRACAGTADGQCASMTGRTDGWDGWISLDGSSYNINVASGNGQYSQGAWAWGSDVVGWVTFNPFNLTTPPCDPTQEVCGGNTTNSTAVVNLYVTPSNPATPTIGSTTVNHTAQLFWNTSNVSTCTTASAGIIPDTVWSGLFTNPSIATSSGDVSTIAFPSIGTETYTLTCIATAVAGGQPISAQVSVNVTQTAGSNPGTGGTMCVNPPTNATLCPGSSQGNGASTLLQSCSAVSGGSSICQYACNAGYHKVNNQCVGNGTIQEQ